MNVPQREKLDRQKEHPAPDGGERHQPLQTAHLPAGLRSPFSLEAAQDGGRKRLLLQQIEQQGIGDKDRLLGFDLGNGGGGAAAGCQGEDEDRQQRHAQQGIEGQRGEE